MTATLELIPESDVVPRDGEWFALSPAPWLRAPVIERWRGRWIRLRYHAGYFDPHVRPLIRFGMGAGARIDAMNGALFGVGEWVGRVPDGDGPIAISPIDRAGGFAFTLVAARPVARLRLLLRGLARSPRLAVTACAARAIGARAEARHCLAFAAIGTPLSAYAAWRDARSRPIAPDGFDRLRLPSGRAPTIHLFPADADCPAEVLAKMGETVAAQAYPDRRFHARAEGVAIAAGDIVGRLAPGDELLPHALEAVAALMAAHPELDACFGDEEELLPSGRLELRLRTDAGEAPAEALFRRVTHAGDASAGAASPAEQVGHLRRVLLRRTIQRPPPAPAAAPPPCDLPVTVIIPTRDRPALLAACLEGLRTTSAHPALSIVLVDNGTTDPAALAILAAAASGPGVTVLRAPGPFNFAALCNAGAAIAETPLLLFLNNDIVPSAAGWIERLAGWAIATDVGAVGARLLYPDGRLQHGGVVVGMGGTALHLDHRARTPGATLGPPDQARVVGAVTGAVLMVERTKFDRVGGFDAEAFPVLLNDVDLCLRLAARGWRTVYEPAATLIHAESASRGRSARPFTLYATERRRFAERWGPAIRDDPAFHPALSLTSLAPALG